MKALQTAIYNKALTGSNTFKTAVNSRFYFFMAPQNTTFPYATYDFVVNTYDNQFNEDFEEFVVQFSIFSQSTSSSEAGDIYGYLTTLFDWCSLTITGYSLVEMKRMSTTTDYFSDDTVWMYTVDYKVWMKKT